MKRLKGILIFPLLWAMRKLHLGDGYEAPTRAEARQQLIEYLNEFHQYENPKDFWNHQK
jgi:hypothetical protein